jgi:hypothetical protein
MSVRPGRPSLAARLLVVATAVGGSALVAPAAEAAPYQESSTTRCTAWHEIGYTVFQDRECVNVAIYSDGQARLTASVYGRRVGGDSGDGNTMRAQAVVRRGDGTRYASARRYMPLRTGYNKQVLVARVTHWYSRPHGTAVGVGHLRGTLPTSDGAFVWTPTHSVSKAY